MTWTKFLSTIVLLLIPCLNFAAPYYGVNFSLPVVTSEPPSLHGYQLMLNYDPNSIKWRQFNIYFDGGFSRLWLNNTPHHQTLNIYSVSPVVRYTFKRHGLILPYLELSIGFSYLNQTRFDDRNFGIHFAFQDRMGLGAHLGQSEQFSVGLHAVHYSNAGLAKHNSGITMPIVLDIGYRFN
jgi:hypothetical protein